MAEIKFYKTGEDWDVFSNVTPIPVHMNINGQGYDAASSEAVYQGCKGLASQNPNDVALSTRLLTDPGATGGKVQQDAKGFNSNTFSHYHKAYNNPDPALAQHSRPNSVTVKEQLMYETCLAKVTQNPEMLKALLETGNTPIVENTALAPYDDPFWGNGYQGNGRNALGKTWMAIRDNLRAELQRTGSIQVRAGLSDNLAHTMGHTNHVRGSQLSGSSISAAQLNQVQSKSVTRNLQPNSHIKRQRAALPMQRAPGRGVGGSQQTRPTNIQMFAEQFRNTHPRQTKLQAGNLTYGVSGRSGGFYIEGQDRSGRPINVHIDKAGQITENGRAVRSSPYADWAMGKIQAHAIQQAPQQQMTRSPALGRVQAPRTQPTFVPPRNFFGEALALHHLLELPEEELEKVQVEEFNLRYF
jgi:predicted NAD-dependent protein-ADP-ribosyltransferase YbiA (DUF1768 family)